MWENTAAYFYSEHWINEWLCRDFDCKCKCMGDMKCNSSPKVEVVSIARAQVKIAGDSQVVDKPGGYHQIIY